MLDAILCSGGNKDLWNDKYNAKYEKCEGGNWRERRLNSGNNRSWGNKGLNWKAAENVEWRNNEGKSWKEYGIRESAESHRLSQFKLH